MPKDTLPPNHKGSTFVEARVFRGLQCWMWKGRVEKQSCVTTFSHLCSCIEEVVDEYPAVFSNEINAESGGLKNSRYQTGVYCCGTRAHHKVLSRSRNSSLECVTLFHTHQTTCNLASHKMGWLGWSTPAFHSCFLFQKVIVCVHSRSFVTLEYFFYWKSLLPSIFRSYQEFVVPGPEKKRTRSKQPKLT